MGNNPTAFVSYAWESDEIKQWVKNLATQLRKAGVDAKIDQWEVVPGDQMPHFMERSVRENNYVLIICTPKYKAKSENRIGGVGYEGDIMTAEVLLTSNNRKFIPILKSGTKETAIPSWLQGKYYIDLSNDHHYEMNFDDLLGTLLKSRETAPELGTIPSRVIRTISKESVKEVDETIIRIKGIIVDEVTQPTNDGTMGSALYKIPFELNKRPDYEWINLFINAWNWPASFSTMHRPGIASVSGNRIFLDGTTIEEVEKYHKVTLKSAVETANKLFADSSTRKKNAANDAQRLKDEHRKNIEDKSKGIIFD